MHSRNKQRSCLSNTIVLSIILPLLVADSGLARQHLTRHLAAGVVHHEYYLPEGPWNIQVLEADLSHGNLIIETAKSHSTLIGRAKTSLLADSLLRLGQNLIGGINGDFFSKEGIPVGCQVLGGVPLKNPIGRSVFAVTKDMRPAIDVVRLQAQLVTSDGKTMQVTGINGLRNENDLILYNFFKGLTTRTNSFGAEAVLKPQTHSLKEGDLHYRVSDILDNRGDAAITNGNWVLSAHGKNHSTLLSALKQGEKVSISISFPPISGPIYSMVGGGPRILRNGAISIENVQENISDAFCQTRHPRTAIGFSEDSSKVFLVTVDGRQAGFSVGMTLSELAEFMWSIGAWQAVNLDGGGSTTMVVGDQVINSPSDATGERPVGNSVFVIANPTAARKRQVEIEPSVAWLGSNTNFAFKVRECDENGRHENAAAEAVNWQCDKRIGKMRRNGELLVAGKPDSGYVRIQYRGSVDSAKVYILPVESVVITPELMAITMESKLNVRAHAFAKNNVKLSNNRFDWSASSKIGKIKEDGFFIPQQEGRTTVRAELRGVWDEAEVEVKPIQ